MRVEEGLLQNRDDFFLRIKAFVASLSDLGWRVLKETSDELYIRSAGDDFFALRNVNRNSYYASSFASGIEIINSSEFSATSDFDNQPSSTNLNPHPNQTRVANPRFFCGFFIPSTTPYDPFVGAAFTFVGDEKNLVCVVNIADTAYRYFILTAMEKNHSFTGGQIISASNLIRKNGGISWGDSSWTAMTETDFSVTPFAFNTSTPTSNPVNHSQCVMGARLGSVHCFSYSVGSSSTSAPKPHPFLCNIRSTYSNPWNGFLGVGLPLAPERLGKYIQTSRYSGLNPLITPQFFYQNDRGRYVYAGHLARLKATPSANLTHKQRLFYGADEYLILKLLTPISSSAPYSLTHHLAVRL